MRDQIRALEVLQELDSHISEIQKNLKAYPEQISRYMDELEAHRTEIDNLKMQLEALYLERGQAEEQLDQNQDLVKRSDERLMAIKTHREFEALEREIADLKKANIAFEERILASLGEIEVLENQLSGVVELLEAKEADYEEKIAELKASLDDYTTQYEGKAKEKSEISSKVNGEVLTTYSRVMKRTGKAVVEARDGVCHGCFMDIPPQLFNDVVRNQKLIQCPNCHRILFYNNDKGDTVATA